MSWPAIVVHGGAGAYAFLGLAGITDTQIENGVIDAATAGFRQMAEGGSSMDAVVAAVVNMENNPIFNCGRGSYLTTNRTIEMDASVMDGSSLKIGGVACITNVTNPILVARAVMDKTPHTLLCGDAAMKFAQNQGFDIVSTEALVTPKAEESFARSPVFGNYGKKHMQSRDPDEHDTVGAVAIDSSGNLAVANSTGGITAKMSGRVGDSPIPGAGLYADETCAVCSTGDGEAMVRVCTCKHAAMLMAQGESSEAALSKALEITKTKGRGSGGCVGMNAAGEIAVVFNTPGMAWASVQNHQIKYGIFPEDNKRREFSDS